MKILSLDGRYYCKVQNGFSIKTLEAYLSRNLKMREGSFAAQYTKKIFRDLFKYARDLRQEYQDYYVQEYDNFETFLYHKELWRHAYIESLALFPEETVLELHPHRSNYNIDSLLDYDENGLVIINQMLEEASM